jgi:hypothetical protein
VVVPSGGHSIAWSTFHAWWAFHCDVHIGSDRLVGQPYAPDILGYISSVTRVSIERLRAGRPEPCP